MLEMLRLLEARRVEVINGSAAYEVEISKLRQLEICRRCGVAAPRTRAVNCPKLLADAAVDLRFPVVVKPNCGGAGSAMQRFNSRGDLERLAAQIDFGADNGALVQEYHAPRRAAAFNAWKCSAASCSTPCASRLPRSTCVPRMPAPRPSARLCALSLLLRSPPPYCRWLVRRGSTLAVWNTLKTPPLGSAILRHQRAVELHRRGRDHRRLQSTVRFVDYPERRPDALRWARR